MAIDRTEAPAFDGTARFEVKRRLGAGGMGAVYEAYDRLRGVSVAVKTLRHDDAGGRARLRREFESLRGLNHPNLVRFGEFIEDAGLCFFTMELIDGEDFISHVRPLTSAGSTKRAACDEARLRTAIAQLAQAISALHQGGKLHRDIKPSNILVTGEGRVVLLDLGLATKLVSMPSSSDQSLSGTVTHMAPEQALAHDVGAPADWYALGVVLYEALTGHLPHSGRTDYELLRKKQERTPPPPRQRVASVPPDLDELCVELLRVGPSQRPMVDEIFERLGVDETQPRAEPRSSSASSMTQLSPFVGREEELALLHAAYHTRCSAGPAAAVVHGESGLGKTELVAQFLRRLNVADDGLVVLFGQCHERAAVPYGALSGIADSLTRFLCGLSEAEAARYLPARAALLPRLFPALLQVKAIATAPLDTHVRLGPLEQRNRMFAAFGELLARVCRSHRVVAVIDDLQWAAPDTLHLLGDLMQMGDAPELLLIATSRPGGEDLLEQAAFGTVRKIHVEELSPARATELVSQLAPGLDLAQAQAIANDAVGHPMFIQEMVRQLSSGAATGTMRLDDALWLRISALESHARQLLDVLVVAGGPLAQETAAAAAGLTYADYEGSMRRLRAGLLARTGRQDAHTVEPYHDRVRSALLGHLDEETLVRCHRELAVALEQSGAATSDPQSLVVHFTAANEPQKSAKYAEVSGLRALAMSAFEQAASSFTTALELGEHNDTAKRSLRLSLAAALVAAGRGPQAADVFLLVAENADGLVRLECKRQAAEQLLISGHLERGIDAMATLLDEVGVRSPATPRRALFSLLWQRARLRIRGLRWKEKQESQIAPELLTRVDVFKAAGDGHGVVDNIRGAAFQVRGLLLALRAGERSRVARAMFYESIFVSSGGPRRLGRAQTLFARATGVAESLDDSYLEAWKTATAGALEYFGGRLRAAAGNFAKAESGFRNQVGATWELNSMHLFRMWSLHRLGALAELKPLLREYVRDADRRGDRYVRTTLLRSCHRVLLDREADEVKREMERAAWVPAEGRYHLQHWYEFASRAEFSLFSCTSQTLLPDVRDTDQRMRRSLLLRIHPVRVDFRWLWARLIIANSATSSAQASELRQVAGFARKLEREGVGYASVMATLLRSAIAVQQAEPERGCRLLRATMEDAVAQDMFLHAGAAQYRLGEILGGDEGAELVTQATVRMNEQGAADAVRMTEMLAPGFARE